MCSICSTTCYWIRDDTDEGSERWQNVQELRSLAVQYAAMPPGNGLTALLENVALVADTDRLPDAVDLGDEREADRVTLITLHAAKGLEFPVVFITGMEEGLFPHSRSLDDPRQMEEERRLAYVGITRAKRHLYLVNARRRTVFGNEQSNQPSRFVKDIPEMLLKDEHRGSGLAAAASGRSLWPIVATGRASSWDEAQSVPEAPPGTSFEVGERVRHKVFGLGTVTATAVDGQAGIVRVRFVDGKGKPVEKTLDTAFAKLESL
jgi:DNA helicase-2/ATP-dependent DNA helicase PcrA